LINIVVLHGTLFFAQPLMQQYLKIFSVRSSKPCGPILLKEYLILEFRKGTSQRKIQPRNLLAKNKRG